MNDEGLSFNIFNSIILAGLLQGFVFVYIVLSQKKYRVTSTYFITALICTWSYSNLIYYLRDVGLISYQTVHMYLMFPFQLLNPALFYFYFKYFLNPEHKDTFREKLLFLPFILGMAFELAFRIPRILDIMPKRYQSLYYVILTVIEFSAIAFTLPVLVYCYFMMTKYEREVKQKMERDTIPGILWFRQMVFGLIMLTLLWLSQVLYETFVDPDVSFYPLWISMSIIIYWLGHVGIYKYGVQQERMKIRQSVKEQRINYVTEKSQNERIASFENYIVENKAYLNPNLSLDDIANAISVSKSHLSRTINAELGVSFSDYINRLRVEEAKIYLENPEFSKYTLVAIGLEAGFNSKTTFNNCFKKFTGSTPSNYRKSADLVATS